MSGRTTATCPLPQEGGKAAGSTVHHRKLPASGATEHRAQEPLSPPSPNAPPHCPGSEGGRGRKAEVRGCAAPRTDPPSGFCLPGSSAQFQPSSLSSWLLMGLKAVRQLSQGAPDSAGQGFKGRGVHAASTLGSRGASRPSSSSHPRLAGARWRPPGLARWARAKVMRRPPNSHLRPAK